MRAAEFTPESYFSENTNPRGSPKQGHRLQGQPRSAGEKARVGDWERSGGGVRGHLRKREDRQGRLGGGRGLWPGAVAWGRPLGAAASRGQAGEPFHTTQVPPPAREH